MGCVCVCVCESDQLYRRTPEGVVGGRSHLLSRLSKCGFLLPLNTFYGSKAILKKITGGFI